MLFRSVFHPRNPYVPIVHMNVRMISATPVDGGEPVAWFGGGMDLTPFYGFEDDAVHFHRTCKNALAPFGDDKYPRFKAWCDDYFFLKHRNEQRGIGGVFYDDFSELGFEGGSAMTRAVGDAFLHATLKDMAAQLQLTQAGDSALERALRVRLRDALGLQQQGQGGAVEGLERRGIHPQHAGLVKRRLQCGKLTLHQAGRKKDKNQKSAGFPRSAHPAVRRPRQWWPS